MKCKNCFNLVQREDYVAGDNYDWCVIKHDNPDVDIERECLYYKCLTNYDRLTRMPPASLAEWIAQRAPGTSAEIWLNWLNYEDEFVDALIRHKDFFCAAGERRADNG